MTSQHLLHRATRHSAKAVLIAITIVAVSSCDEPSRTTSPSRKVAANPAFTMGQGSTPTFLGQGTYSDLMVKRIDKDWQVQLKAKDGLEVVVRSFAYNVGAVTGWHKHPGPVLIQVIEGTVTFFEADKPCTPIVVHAGQGYLDAGDVGHIGRNLSGAPAKDITINLAPPGTQLSQLRIDMPAPPGSERCS